MDAAAAHGAEMAKGAALMDALAPDGENRALRVKTLKSAKIPCFPVRI